MDINRVIDYLRKYDGPPVKLMEVCGTHTAAIARAGIKSLISPKIKLISGPGCPVCVTPASYIDKCAEYALKENHELLTFGDMMRVPGNSGSLSEAKARGARVRIMYSPFEAIEKAKENPDITYVIAAVGFETTAPAYALLLKEAEAKGIKNIKLITALKTIIPALSWICENEKGIDGFICPGHVSAIIGSKGYGELAEKYNKPFVIAGFEPEHILAAIYELITAIEAGGRPRARNLYKSAVKEEGNIKAQAAIAGCFKEGDAWWRGIGVIKNSGLYINEKYSAYDGGSIGPDGYKEEKMPEGCRCGEVIVGRISPDECPMFGKACSPEKPLGPCMVSGEGACGIIYNNIER